MRLIPIKKKILKVYKNKSSHILVKVIKDVAVFTSFIGETINSAFKLFFFPASFKSADVTTLHKKGKKDLKEN